MDGTLTVIHNPGRVDLEVIVIKRYYLLFLTPEVDRFNGRKRTFKYSKLDPETREHFCNWEKSISNSLKVITLLVILVGVQKYDLQSHFFYYQGDYMLKN